MIFVADVIPGMLRRIVEFLNEQMDPAEVLAVEVQQYVNTGENVPKTLVPRVFGQLQKKRLADRRVISEQEFESGIRANGEGIWEAVSDFRKQCEALGGMFRPYSTGMGAYFPLGDNKNAVMVYLDTCQDAVLNGQGVPTFKIKEGVAYDFIELFAPSVDRLADGEFDVFCFGTLAQRAKASRSTLQRMLDACKSQHIFYDVNLREDCFTKDIIEQSLKYCTIAKMNDDEVGVLSNMFFGRVLPESDFAETLLQTFEIEVLCITKGSQGCGVHWDGRHESCPGVDVKVVDTVGSGDAFSAAFLYKYLGGADPVESATLANRIGAFVASKRGAIPLYSGEIRALVQCC